MVAGAAGRACRRAFLLLQMLVVLVGAALGLDKEGGEMQEASKRAAVHDEQLLVLGKLRTGDLLLGWGVHRGSFCTVPLGLSLLTGGTS